MSGFIDKIANKMQGGQSHDSQDQEDFSGRSGQRSGQQNLASAGGRDQQFSTQSGQNDDYGDNTQFNSGRQSGSGLDNDGLLGTTGRSKHSSGQRSGLEDEFSTQQESTGRQTRSQAGSGMMGSGQGQGQGQGSFPDKTQDMGRRGVDRGVQEGEKYINRNL